MIQECQRCGTCCRKGPPALHDPDKELYFSGVLNKEHLMTLRKGEYVFDNIQNHIQQLSEEMIRIRSKEGCKSCLFVNDTTNDCDIYLDRPLECRAMKCWDNQDIIDTYARSRLKRKDLIPQDSALYEIILEHETKCSLSDVLQLVRMFKKEEREDLLTEISGLIDIDLNIRRFLLEKTGAESRSLEFVLGRSLDRILPGLGLKVEFTQKGYRFHKVGT